MSGLGKAYVSFLLSEWVGEKKGNLSDSEKCKGGREGRKTDRRNIENMSQSFKATKSNPTQQQIQGLTADRNRRHRPLLVGGVQC